MISLRYKLSLIIIFILVFMLLPKKSLAVDCLFSFDSYSLDYQITNGSKVNLLTLPRGQYDNRGGPYPSIAYYATSDYPGKLIATGNITVRGCNNVRYRFLVRYWDGSSWQRQESVEYNSSGNSWWQDSKSHIFTPKSGIAFYYVDMQIYATSSNGSWYSNNEVINFMSDYLNPGSSFTGDCINKTCSSSDISVFSDGTISVSSTVKNTGNSPSGWWYMGIEGWKVNDYHDPRNTRSNPFFAYYNASNSSSGGLNQPSITCTADSNKPLNLGESRVVTCNFPSSLWGPTSGNQRIMFWAHERDLGVDRNGICETVYSPDTCGSSAKNCASNTGCWGGAWWSDALTRIEPSQVKVIISSQSAPAISTSGSSSFNAGACTASDNSLSRASGLISAPDLTGKFNTTAGACVIDPKSAFVPFKIHNFEELKSLYYNQK